LQNVKVNFGACCIFSKHQHIYIYIYIYIYICQSWKVCTTPQPTDDAEDVRNPVKYMVRCTYYFILHWFAHSKITQIDMTRNTVIDKILCNQQ
jgi:hypothetical protein